MRLLAIMWVVGAGCGFQVGAGSSSPDDAHPSDAIDAFIEPDAPDAPASCSLWHPRHIDPCVIGTPKPQLTITAVDSPWIYDTTTQGGALTNKNGAVLSSSVVVMQPDGTMFGVLNVAGMTVEAGAQLLVIGDKPLLVASWSTIAVAGTIDAGSSTEEIDNTNNAHIDGPKRIGAGANPTGLCGGMTGVVGSNAVASGGSGGGGGGALQGAGGHGAIGDNNAAITGGPGGSRMSVAPTVLRGGCAGGTSGTAGSGVQAPATSSTVSVGGAGGGAIELTAQTSITITGRINAGGGGGAGSPQGSAAGAGGGGSGGYVGVEAPTVTITNGTLSANGGGGGGSSAFASQGNQGANATAAAQAAGGASSANPPTTTCGLAGAAGSVGSTLDGPNAAGADSCGGGGGGGGAGFIFVWAPALAKSGAMISPAALP